MTKSEVTADDLIEYFGVGKFQFVYIAVISLIEATEAIETLSLALVGSILKCDWYLTYFEAASVATLLYFGIFLGSITFGGVTDHIGRQPAIHVGNVIVIIFSILATLAPTINWMYFLRFIFGFGLGAVYINTPTILSEISPKHFRAKSEIIMYIFWPIGTLLMVGVACLILPYTSWRWFLAATSLPFIIAFIPIYFLPDTLRFYFISKNRKGIDKVLTLLSKWNKKPIPESLKITYQPQSREGFITLFEKKYLRLTLLQMLAFITGGFMYFGAVFLSSTLPAIKYHCLQDNSRFMMSKADRFDNSCCSKPTAKVYKDVAIATIGDLVSCSFSFFLLDLIGRKKTISIFGIVSALCFLVLDLCMSEILRAIMLLVLRCFTIGFLNGWCIFSPELYPTTIRGRGYGFIFAMSRIGGMLSPYLSMVLIHYNTRLTLVIFAIISAIGTTATMLIPTETSGASLVDTASFGPSKKESSALEDIKTNYESLKNTKAE